MSRRTLIGLRQSPWTERARWALDHHGIVFTYHEHLPMLGEVLLRRKARRLTTKKASVPLLVDETADSTVVMGSLEIAKHAEGIGRGAALFPRAHDAAVAHWVDAAEQLARVGRAWVLKRLLQSRAGQAEALPSFIPGALRGAMAPTSAMAIRFLAKKYDVPDDVEAEIERTTRPLLEETRKALSGGGGMYLVGNAFSFADLAIASTMHAIRPREKIEGVGPATVQAWTNEALVRDFGDLLEWRDAIYTKHR